MKNIEWEIETDNGKEKRSFRRLLPLNNQMFERKAKAVFEEFHKCLNANAVPVVRAKLTVSEDGRTLLRYKYFLGAASLAGKARWIKLFNDAR